MQNQQDQGDFQRRFTECDDKFNSIFELTSAASKIIDADLTILKVNKALVDLLGYPAEQIEGTKIIDYACEEYKEHWHDLQDALWSRKLPFFKLEVCLYRKDGSLAWVKITTILFNDQGVTYGFTVLDDITYFKQFQNSENRLNMALQYSKMAVWEMNLLDRIVARSESHDELFGYEEQEQNWTIEKYYQHFIEEDVIAFKEAIERLSDSGGLDFQGRIQTLQGLIKWLHFQGKIQEDEKGNPYRILGTIKDITKEKLAERHKDDFISIASHELKTPVTSLNGSLQLLNREKDGLSVRLQSFIDQANKSTKRIALLIDDLLNASKLNEDQLHLKRTVFNLAKVMEECCEQIRLGGTNAIVLEGDLSLEVYADSERIERVVINFVNNAIKYAPDSRKITIRIDEQDGMARVSVTDSGPGIPEEKLPHLFDRFYRADNSGYQYSGLGLGLYISAEIIKKHGGDIGVRSEMGKGSTFWFTIPRHQPIP